MGDFYKAIVHNDNSVLYASGAKNYKEEIVNIFKDFNYKYELNAQGLKVLWYSLYILLFIFIVSMWGTLKKTRKKGWISLIPFYNIWCLSKDVLGSPFYSLLLLLPIVNTVFMFIFYYNMGKVFSKNDSFCVLLMFFPSICWPLLAFDDSKYAKPERKNKKDINQFGKQISNNNYVKKDKINSGKKIPIGKKIIGIIKWIFTVFLFLIGVMFCLIYFDERVIGYLVVGIFFIIYSTLLCPTITKSTIKYEKYTKFKPLIVIFLVVFLIILFCVLPF